jgi:type IV fimbrial biogenesis protein FimT
MQKKLSKNLGFTMVEILVTVAIAAVVMGLAIPSFTSTISSNRLTSFTNEFVTSLNFARSEAIKRGFKIVVERTGAVGWEGGWRVYLDGDGSNAFNDNGVNPLCEPAVGAAIPEDCVLRVYNGFTSSYKLRANGTTLPDLISYNSLGMNNVVGSFILCDDSDGNQTAEDNTAKLITINRVGRLRTADAASGTSCTSP